MIKARPKYPTDLYGTIYIDNIQKAVVICLIILTTFPFDSGSRVDNVRHTSRYFFMLDRHRRLNSRDSAFQNGDRFQVLTDFNGREDI
jgi:hypothetical protein